MSRNAARREGIFWIILLLTGIVLLTGGVIMALTVPPHG
jgi:hypothetical protein